MSPNPKSDSSDPDAELLAAVTRNDLEAMRRCLERGASPNGRRRFFTRRSTPLQYAVQYADVEIVRLLLVAGADPDHKAPGSYPIEAAARRGHLAMVSVLLGEGAGMRGALLQAAAYGNMEVLELLLARGAKPQSALLGGVSSQLRMHGAILRRLRAAGGVLAPEIERMVNMRAARGDHESSSG